MSAGSSSGAAHRKKKATAKKREEPGRKSSSDNNKSTSSEVSGRGERERTKWRKRKRERELKKAEEMLEQKKKLAEEEAAKRKLENQKKEVKKHSDETEKILASAELAQKATETMINDYRASKNMIRYQLSSHSNEIIQTQHLEKSHLTAVSDRIRQSEVQLLRLEAELTKTKQIREDFIRDSAQNWFVQFWKWLY
ncbi:unnamed protein product [Caenorhabditis brenneri]